MRRCVAMCAASLSDRLVSGVVELPESTSPTQYVPIADQPLKIESIFAAASA
jgi:hypothetical protein